MYEIYVQEDTSRQVDLWIKATGLIIAFAFLKMCFDEEVAWDCFY